MYDRSPRHEHDFVFPIISQNNMPVFFHESYCRWAHTLPSALGAETDRSLPLHFFRAHSDVDASRKEYHCHNNLFSRMSFSFMLQP
jgi:hypothetical protein